MQLCNVSLYYLFFIAIIFVSNQCHGGIFSWMFKNYENTADEGILDEKDSRELIEEPRTTASMKAKGIKPVEDDRALLASIPFEINSVDQSFINEVSKFTNNISELDICHHKVILELEKSCSALNEEELAKTAVNLLNCQSAVEGRDIYPCTKKMTLQLCTKDMDQNTWNAYHIISNRVRAVCYHFRQQQFTAKTEMTVNKLVLSAESQIDAMKLLEESQCVLREATSDTLNNLSSGHRMLQKQQDELSSAHLNIRNYVADNIRDLTREKNLIASGQRELAQITLTIRTKLEEAQKQLQDQGLGQQNTHKKILQDLSDIQESASLVWKQLDQSTKAILEKHEQTVSQYGHLMKDLQKMNATVHHLMDISVRMKAKLEEKFFWISALLGDTDATVQKIYSFVLHCGYCVFGMVAASFLQVPYATRMALIILVPLNAISEMKNDLSLHFSTLTLVLAVCMFFNLTTIGAVKVYQWQKKRRTEVPTAQSLHCEDADQQRKEHVATPGATISFMSTEVTPEEENSNYEYSNENDFPPQKDHSTPTGKRSGTSKRFISPLGNIAEEKTDLSAAFAGETPRSVFSTYSSWAGEKSPGVWNDSVRRRLLARVDDSHSDSSPPCDLLSGSINDSFTSPNRFSSSLTERKTFRSVTPVGKSRSLSQSLTSKKLCSASTRSGLLCRNTASGGPFCHKHLKGVSRESTPAV